jgi:hypothetical protein
MTDAAARYQSIDGEARVVQNLVYNPSSGNWELEQQGVIEAVTGNLYLAVDELESKLDSAQAVLVTIDQAIDDQLLDYSFSGWVVSGTAVYTGYEDKDGNYVVKYFETSTGVVTFAVGSGGIVAPGSYSGLSYGSFASKF